MNTLTANETMLATLSQIDDQAEIRDDAGRLIGYFIPVRWEEEAWYESVKPALDPAELERRSREPGPRRTTRELLEHLLSMTSDEDARSHLQRTIAQVAVRDGCPTP